MARFARSPLGILGAQLTWFGMLSMPLALPTVMLGPILLAGLRATTATSR